MRTPLISQSGSEGGSAYGSIASPPRVEVAEKRAGKKKGGKGKGKGGNINVKAAFIHVVGDFCQSVGVLVAALIIFFKVGCSCCLWWW